MPLLTVVDFNPRSSCEERQTPQSASSGNADFNPRSSCEERRKPALRRLRAGADFNPRSSCEERPDTTVNFDSCHFISIHAPHARSDYSNSRCLSGFCQISIHAPHARSDSSWSSTWKAGKYFNPRSSCEERR